ncbi:MAG: LytTR family DNA-binding domain-containing protein [Gemmatimonadaceae bacterium]|jgi:two-component system LytT family response regulator|nr:LytTR family DNA-binding domain-containing protein [Gemmatimonadaceae bacterium]
MIRALIADDEPLARQALRRFLAAHADVQVLGEAEDLPSLRALLHTQRADVLFLDITMPGGTGLDILPEVPLDLALVFTTAHAEHAAHAFAIDAVDYLVKPFGAERVRTTLERVRRRRAGTVTSSTPESLLVRLGQRLHVVSLDSVWRFEGADDYVRIITATREWLHTDTLDALTRRFDPTQFVRVHRRHLIALRHVQRFEQQGDRQLAAIFADGSRVVCSRDGATRVRAIARASEDSASGH